MRTAILNAVLTFVAVVTATAAVDPHALLLVKPRLPGSAVAERAVPVCVFAEAHVPLLSRTASAAASLDVVVTGSDCGTAVGAEHAAAGAQPHMPHSEQGLGQPASPEGSPGNCRQCSEASLEPGTAL
jgi:hypothetical protein